MPDKAFDAIKKGDMSALNQRIAEFKDTPSGHVHLSSLRDPMGCSLTTLAAKLNRADAIASLAKAGVFIQAPDDSGETALHVAAYFGNLGAIQEIARHLRPAHVDAPDSTSQTALARAASNGQVAAARTLIELGANPRVMDGASEGPAHLAARDGHAEMVQVLLEHDPRLLEKQNIDGESPGLIAADAGHVDVVRKLVSARVNVYIQLEDGSHAGHVAALNGHASMFEAGVLEDQRALSAANSDGLTPAHLAAVHGHTAVLEAMIRLGVPMPRDVHAWPANLQEASVASWQGRVSQAAGAVAIEELERTRENLAVDLSCRITFQPFAEVGDSRPVRLPTGSIVSAQCVDQIFHPPVHEIYGRSDPRDPFTNEKLDPDGYDAFVASADFKAGDPTRLRLVQDVHEIYLKGGDLKDRAQNAVDAVAETAKAAVAAADAQKHFSSFLPGAQEQASTAPPARAPSPRPGPGPGH